MDRHGLRDACSDAPTGPGADAVLRVNSGVWHRAETQRQEACVDGCHGVLAAGGELVTHSPVNSVTDDVVSEWLAVADLESLCVERCRCSLLVGFKRELSVQVILLVTPVVETVDLPSLSAALGLTRGLRAGQSKVCRRLFGCSPRFLSPLAAFAAPGDARVILSSALPNSTQRVAMLTAPGETLVCSVGSLVDVLRQKEVQVQCGVAVVAAGATPAVRMPVVPQDLALQSALADYAGQVFHVRTASDCVVSGVFRNLRTGLRGCEDTLVVESPEAIRVLLGGDFTVDQLLLKPSLFMSLRESLEARALRRGENLVPVLLCDAAVLEQISGIPAAHASAAFASVRRRPVSHCLSEIPAMAQGSRVRVLVIDGLDEEMVGSLCRAAACFGVDAVLLSEDSGDPFSRKSARVSMGHVFRTAFVRGSVPLLLRELRSLEVFTLGLAWAREECRTLDSLAGVPARWACVLGPEGASLSADVRACCDLVVQVPLAVPSCCVGEGVLASIMLNRCLEMEALARET